MGYQYLHSTFKKSDNGDEAIIVTLKDPETKEKTFEVIENPQRRFWVTKSGCRNHKYKKEFEWQRNLDEIRCTNKDIAQSLSVALTGRPSKRPNLNRLLQSPYVYGADIDMQTLVKMHYHKQYGKYSGDLVTGGYDIETSIITPDKEVIIASIGFENKLYCSVFKPFLKSNYKTLMKVIHESFEKYKHGLNTNHVLGLISDKQYKLQKDYFDNIEIEVKLFDREVDVIGYIFNVIDTYKPDFIGVWKMDFDIPYCIERLKALGVDYHKLLSSKDAPVKYRNIDYHQDKRKIDHITDKWDWYDAISYTQFVDYMCLYGRLRKVKGRDPKYSLDFIANKELGSGKIDFQDDGHASMQANRFEEYVAYNLIDTALIVIMDIKNRDIQNMCGIIGDSLLKDFSKQTVQLRNVFYEYCLERDAVPAAVKGDLSTELDKLQAAMGGTVLSPQKAPTVGMKALEETDQRTLLCNMVADIDVSKHTAPRSGNTAMITSLIAGNS